MTADQLHSGSNPDLGFGVLPSIYGDSGHSSWETPGLIPNPEVKPTHVACCTEVRESPGSMPSCYHLPSFLPSFLYTTTVLVLFRQRADALIMSLYRFYGYRQVRDLHDTFVLSQSRITRYSIPAPVPGCRDISPCRISVQASRDGRHQRHRLAGGILVPVPTLRGLL